MARQSSPDYVVDADRGTGDIGAKAAEVITPAQAWGRDDAREGLADLDRRLESMPGLTAQQRDRERIGTRDASAPLGHERMRRQLPAPESLREPLSSRQKKARSKVHYEAQSALPDTQYSATRSLVTDHQTWTKVNDQLSDHVGDVGELDEDTARQVRRTDTAIRAFERRNERGHVVYANVQMPTHINATNVSGFLNNAFKPGQQIVFDRYTGATHQLHETSGFLSERTREVTPVFEIQTRRGMYLGGSDSQDNTRHLLPRSMAFEVVGTHTATYRTPDGVVGQRPVIQIRDINS